ncbi:unnamed protein product [marine sediment metagenome]|uniref:Uncharacterized protein n=1 Tax=marine sediment metagenome TaxID=412755 RepID=X1FM78_9ZZZZ
MGEGAGVDDRPFHFADVGMEAVDYVPFVIALKEDLIVVGQIGLSGLLNPISRLSHF